MPVNDLDRCTSGGAEGKSVFGAWVRCGENSFKQEKAGVLAGRWADWKIWTCQCVDRVLLDRLNEPRAGGFCLELHRTMLSDAIQMCLHLRHPLSFLSPTLISRRGVVQVREISTNA